MSGEKHVLEQSVLVMSCEEQLHKQLLETAVRDLFQLQQEIFCKTQFIWMTCVWKQIKILIRK